MRSKYLKKVIAAVGLILFWEIASFIAKSGGPYTAVLVPSWGEVLKEALPGFAAFRNGSLPNYGDAFYILFVNSLITIILSQSAGL